MPVWGLPSTACQDDQFCAPALTFTREGGMLQIGRFSAPFKVVTGLCEPEARYGSIGPGPAGVPPLEPGSASRSDAWPGAFHSSGNFRVGEIGAIDIDLDAAHEPHIRIAKIRAPQVDDHAGRRDQATDNPQRRVHVLSRLDIRSPGRLGIGS